MTTEFRPRRPGRLAVPATVTMVVGVATASIAWAAAHPPVASPPAATPRPVSAPQPAASTPLEALRIRQQVDAIAKQLHALRRATDVLRTVRLPAPSSSVPTRQQNLYVGVVPPVMPSYTPPPPPVLAAPAPPATHASTGASGAPR